MESREGGKARCGGRLERGAAAALFGVLLVALSVIAAGCGGSDRSSAGTTTAAQATAPRLRGLIPRPMPYKPSFTLTDTSGQPFRFGPATRGKLTYLYFGYTHCPDACPAAMSDISYALRLQKPAVRRRIAVVFVTVDPHRDTRGVLRTWLDHYSRSFVGLTGTPSQIAAVERAAGVPPSPQGATSGKKYDVAHSSLLFAYSPDGRAHVVYAQGFKPGDYAHDMPLLLGL